MNDINGYIGIELDYFNLINISGYTVDNLLNGKDATEDVKILLRLMLKCENNEPINKPIYITYIDEDGRRTTPKNVEIVDMEFIDGEEHTNAIAVPLKLFYSGVESDGKWPVLASCFLAFYKETREVYFRIN